MRFFVYLSQKYIKDASWLYLILKDFCSKKLKIKIKFGQRFQFFKDFKKVNCFILDVQLKKNVNEYGWARHFDELRKLLKDLVVKLYPSQSANSKTSKYFSIVSTMYELNTPFFITSTIMTNLCSFIGCNW